MSNPTYVMVIDPLNFGGLLKVPLSKTFDTKGRNDWLKGVLKKDLSLCCLFQRGKCHAGVKCHQVHADRNFVADLRAQCSQITSCCLRCGDTASSYPAGRAAFSDLRTAGCTFVNVQGVSYPLDLLAYTVGLAGFMSAAPRLHTLLAGDALVIPASRVCRLHLRGGCKYGKDCKNFHLCSQLGEAVLQACAKAMSDGDTNVQNTVMTPPVNAPIVTRRSPPYVALPSPPPSSVAFSSVPPSVESSFNQESINIPTQVNNAARHSFGDELNDEESIGPGEELSFELKIVSEKKSNFLFRWSHPASSSPLPTCVASTSLRQLVSPLSGNS